MPAADALDLDVVIFGGGAAGLWLLDELRRDGFAVLLLEAGDLGSGQTIASQGIIHGGLKYTLTGLFTSSAKAIRDMPLIWRRCLAGEIMPDLSRTRLRAEHCHLWQTRSLKSRLAMLGARAGLRIAPVTLKEDDRPLALMSCPGVVARLDEQVIEPASFLSSLADRNREHILRIDADAGLEFEKDSDGLVQAVHLINPSTGRPAMLRPRQVVLTAGAGSGGLREKLGLPLNLMQLRPLQMVMLRGSLLPLNGHCVDGARTRVTITTTTDSADQTIWQVGGELAEVGAAMRDVELLARAKSELAEVLPSVDLSRAQWATYRADRAEARTSSGHRPDDASAILERNIITAFPTKLALAPRLAMMLKDLLGPRTSAASTAADSLATFADWPRPAVALPPWETQSQWFTDP